MAVPPHESAPGPGTACGPPAGALLGDANRRSPFFGTAALMAVGLLCAAAFPREQPTPARKTSPLDPLGALGHGGPASAVVPAFFYNHTFFTVAAFTPFAPSMPPYRPGAVSFARGALLVVFSVLVAPRLRKRFGPPEVPGGSPALLAVDVLLLGYGDHTTAVVRTVPSGALIGVDNTVRTEPALGVPDAPRPVASAGYNFVRWFAVAAAPLFAPNNEEWTDVRVPSVVPAVTATPGALVVVVRHRALGLPAAAERQPRHASGDGAGVFAD